MILPLLAILQALLFQIALAGPIHRNADVVRRANAPPKRFIALSKPISFHLLHPRATGGTGVTSTIPEATASAASTSEEKEDGKVPAVGIGAGNTSLLTLLSSALAASTLETSTPASTSMTSTTSTSPTGFQAEATSSLTSTSAGKEDGKVPAVGVGAGNTSLLALLSSALVSSTGPPTVAVDGAQSTQAAAQNDSQISASSASQTCSNTIPTSAIPNITSAAPIPAAPNSPQQSTTSTTFTTSTTLTTSTAATTTIIQTVSSPDSLVQSTSTLSESATNSPSVPAGSTITLRISTTMTTTVESAPEPDPTSETASNLQSPVPLASTTVTPLVNPETQNLVTASNSAIPTPTPAVSIQTPQASSEAMPSAPAAASTNGSPGMTIPLGAFTIVVNSAPAPTPAGNTVIPIMPSFITVTVTETVTAR